MEYMVGIKKFGRVEILGTIEAKNRLDAINKLHIDASTFNSGSMVADDFKNDGRGDIYDEGITADIVVVPLDDVMEVSVEGTYGKGGWEFTIKNVIG